MQVFPPRLSSLEFTDSFSRKLRIEEPLEMSVEDEAVVDDSSQDDEDESDCDFAFAPDGGCDFSFAPNGEDSSQISAEEIFSDGLIRPAFPFFNRDILFSGDGNGDGDEVRDSGASLSSPLRPPLKKLFSEQLSVREEEEDSPATEAVATDITGPCCEWSSSSRKEVLETSPGVCKKSNSTGFSKLWRFRDIVKRSSSDGKDAFVFLNSAAETAGGQKTESSPELPSEGRKTSEGKVRGGAATAVGERKVRARRPQGETASVAYMRKREAAKAKEREKRRSYLPYRQDLLGFFTNVNGLSRNVHPF